MIKKMLVLALLLTFMAGTATVALAKGIDCKVASIDGKTVTLECKNIGKMKVKDTLKIKIAKKKAGGDC